MTMDKNKNDKPHALTIRELRWLLIGALICLILLLVSRL
jgi:hypothetical protein